MARLVVFDIDGTLCDTNAVDDACFVQAVGEFLGVDPSVIDWSAAPHVTDSGLLTWLCAQHHHGAPDAAEVESVMRRFLELLRAKAVCAAAEWFRPIPGGPRALACLPEHQWDVALATGGWERSAHFKLSQIGVDADRLILATANDAITRTDIIGTAIGRAQVRYGHSYTRIVSVGDGPWDVRAAAELDLPFVGVAHGERATRLRDAGATTILDDLADLASLHDALERATVPAIPRLSVSA